MEQEKKKTKKTCYFCKHCQLGSHNNNWCDTGGRGTIRPTWGGWRIDANKCKDFEVSDYFKDVIFE